jgi:hypothetical protein
MSRRKRTLAPRGESAFHETKEESEKITEGDS